MAQKLTQIQEQLAELMLREQRAKTERAELELERARIELEATRAFVRANPLTSAGKPS